MMTTPDMQRLDERMHLLEMQMAQMALDMRALNSLKDQISGMVNLVKFVGWSGFVAILVVAGRLVVKGL